MLFVALYNYQYIHTEMCYINTPPPTKWNNPEQKTLIGDRRPKYKTGPGKH